MVRPVINRILRQLLLALVAPVAVQAGVQLQPTAVFLLDRDIAASRCAGGGGQKQDHHAGGECCVMCAAPQLPESVSIETAQALVFPDDAFPVIAAQTIGLNLGLALRPPIPRGPPA